MGAAACGSGERLWAVWLLCSWQGVVRPMGAKEPLDFTRAGYRWEIPWHLLDAVSPREMTINTEDSAVVCACLPAAC